MGPCPWLQPSRALLSFFPLLGETEKLERTGVDISPSPSWSDSGSFPCEQAQNRMLWHISRLLLFPSPCWKLLGIFFPTVFTMRNWKNSWRYWGSPMLSPQFFTLKLMYIHLINYSLSFPTNSCSCWLLLLVSCDSL